MLPLPDLPRRTIDALRPRCSLLCCTGQHDGGQNLDRRQDDGPHQVGHHPTPVLPRTFGGQWRIQILLSVGVRPVVLPVYDRYDVSPWLGAKLQLQMAPEKGMSQSMLDLEFKVRTPAAHAHRFLLTCAAT
jgi:hypothetical protein